MLKLYSFKLSGNCYKVRLFLAQLELPYEVIELNILQGETRRPEFLQKSPMGRLPALELDSGEVLLESNAILCYLGRGTGYFPEDELLQARVMQWLFFEQYSIAANIGPARFWIKFLQKADEFQAQIQQKQKLGYAALETLEQHLLTQAFVVENIYTIADVSLFAYVHLAPDGDFDLGRFPAIQAWIERVQSQAEYIAITNKL